MSRPADAVGPALLMLADGRFPTGGHAHSAGVESAVAIGDVDDLDSLRRTLHARLATTGVVDAAFAAAACGRVCDRIGDDLRTELDQLGVALDARLLSPRARTVSRRLGRQQLRVGRVAWSHPALDHLATPPGPHQAIAAGALVAVAGGTPAYAARLAMHHLTAAVTGAGVRLLGLDPLAAAALGVDSGALVDALAGDADRWGSCAPAELPALGGALGEILAEHHGTWPTRLFVG